MGKSRFDFGRPYWRAARPGRRWIDPAFCCVRGPSISSHPQGQGKTEEREKETTQGGIGVSDYKMMRLFLAVSEHDRVQSDLARIARRHTYSDGERKEKQTTLFRLMKERDLLTEEIRTLEGRAA